MSNIQDTLIIHVEYNTEDGIVYIATNDDIGLVTDGQTFGELLKNLQEAVAVCLDETDTIAEFNLVPNPRVKLILELPENYAEIA